MVIQGSAGREDPPFGPCETTYLSSPFLDGMSGGAGDCCREPRASIRQRRTGAGTGDADSSSLRTEQLPMRQGPCNDLYAGLPDGSSLLVPKGGVRLPHFPPVSGTALRSGSQFWMEPRGSVMELRVQIGSGSEGLLWRINFSGKPLLSTESL